MVRVPGARQSQKDVAITSNIVLIKLVIITHSQHNHHTIYGEMSVHPFVNYGVFPYVVKKLPVSILQMFSAESPNLRNSK